MSNLVQACVIVCLLITRHLHEHWFSAVHISGSTTLRHLRGKVKAVTEGIRSFHDSFVYGCCHRRPLGVISIATACVCFCLQSKASYAFGNLSSSAVTLIRPIITSALRKTNCSLKMQDLVPGVSFCADTNFCITCLQAQVENILYGKKSQHCSDWGEWQ